MAWKLKKSKVEDNGDAPETSSGIVISHGHTSINEQSGEDTDDFFASHVDDADDIIHGLNSARQSPFEEDIFMTEHPLPKHDDIPVIQSAFVSAEPEDEVVPHETSAKSIDFGDVEFGSDDEPDTLEFGSSPIETEQQHYTKSNGSVPTIDFDAPEAPVITASQVPNLETTLQMHNPSVIAHEPQLVATSAVSAEPIEAPEAISSEIETSASAPPVAEIIKAPTLPMPTKVVVKLGPFAAEQDLAAVGAEMVIGRRDYNTDDSPAISVDLDDAISRRHARILVLDGGCKIEDIGSTNGTKINGQPLMANVPMPFNIGDVVRIGERTEIMLK